MADRGGYRSRKMVMAYVVMALGSVGFVMTAVWPALGVTFAEYCMFLLGAASIYASSNAAVKWMTAKQQLRQTPQKTAAAPEKEAAAEPPANPGAD